MLLYIMHVAEIEMVCLCVCAILCLPAGASYSRAIIWHMLSVGMNSSLTESSSMLSKGIAVGLSMRNPCCQEAQFHYCYYGIH